MIVIKRVYEKPEPDDGYRVLVDRLWPRGLTRAAAALDDWLKDIAPSPDLRRAFHRGRIDWPEFAERYRSELRSPAAAGLLADLRARAAKGRVTLLYGKHDPIENHAAILREVIAKSPARRGKVAKAGQ